MNQDGDVREYFVVCDGCGTEWEIISKLKDGFADWIDVYCPECGNLLGDFRDDISCNIRRINHGKQS